MVVRLKGAERTAKTSAIVSGGFEAEIEVISSDEENPRQVPTLMNLEIKEGRYWG